MTRLPAFARRSATLSLVVLLGLAGCTSDSGLHPVKGKVTFKKAPAVGALVVFHPKGNSQIDAIRPSGVVGDDGTFELASPGPRPGAPAGEYEIAVTWDQPPPPPPAGKMNMGGGEAKTLKDKFDGKYANPQKSRLTATVKPGPNEIPVFELD